MSKNITFEADVECYSCHGSGLYKGMAEKDGAAVICHTCNGTGKKHVKHVYKEFTGKKKRTDVKRVYKTAGGYCITHEDTRDIKFSKAGCDYTEWFSNDSIKPKPIKDLHCPMLHYGQGSKIMKTHTKYMCDKLCSVGNLISHCASKNKKECWKLFDKE